ncbi:hypothetical protein DM01DRAFT_1299585 [Hesseltinella vesiculosa]|uniref:THO complex subunit 2 n=1 Tax=Hesseltinella vesiculosa TaxID=101127 RepID=A0A1X2GU82_9FUNG|nr:hypothetical protein DM01DRAFT_1299585 [Hesseltinella vesiculosa]
MNQEELDLAQQYARDYSPDNTNLRQLITRTAYRSCVGERSVDHFIELFKSLLQNEDLSNSNVDVRMFFVNSIKSQDTHVESLEESGPAENKERAQVFKENIVAMIKGALDAKLLTEDDCKIHFNSSLLETAKIIPNKTFFEKRLIRINTALLYKQNKFNLLRENSVGYSALVNDIVIGTIDLQRDAYGRLPPTPLNRIPRFLNIISSHVGNFHLDPNRVLDILLDFYIKEVLINYAFWIELFKQSVWLRQSSNGPDQEDHAPQASPVLAQLLGFKMASYHTLQPPQAPSQEMYFSAALLISHGLITLGDVLPYLSPSLDQMEKDTKDYMEHMDKEISTNSGGLLAQYGALGEEGGTKKADTPAAVQPEADGDTKGQHANDVVELTKALLSLGDLSHAEEILAKYNKLVDLHPTLAHYIYRIASRMLEPAYEHYVPDDLKARTTFFMECALQSEIRAALGNPAAKPDGPHLANGLPARTLLELPKLKTYYVLDSLRDGTHNLKDRHVFRFFYTRWADDLPSVTNFDEFTSKFMPIMRLAGYRMYLAPQLTHKLLQVLLALFERKEANPGTPQRQVVMVMVRELLLPAISFGNGNPGLMASVWELIDLLTYQERCSLYGEWGNDFFKKSIECKLLKARTERAVKTVMRRMSKNDVRQCGRDLGKLSHGNPTIVFSVMLDQIQMFDNLAPLLADSCRYMSNFSYDVLAYYLTEKWTGSQGPGRMKKQKMREPGMASPWLRSLAVFAGMFFKKGNDPTPLLRYLLTRLRHNDSVDDLILMNEFITKLGGIEMVGDSLTSGQIVAAGCGGTLKAEAFQPVSADNRRATKRAVSRLKDALTKDNVAVELLVLLYRLHDTCTNDMDMSTYERCKRSDLVHKTILQFSDLLVSIFDEAEYSALIPSVDVLLKDYGLLWTSIMQIVRPKTQYLLHSAAPLSTSDEPSEKPSEKPSDKSSDNNMDVDPPNNENGKNLDHQSEAHPVLQPLIQMVPDMLPQYTTLFNVISPEFFVTFWQLSIYDIYCPVQRYEAAIKTHHDTIQQCRDPSSSLSQSMRPSALSKRQRQAQASVDALTADLARHRQDVQRTIALLQASKHRWFSPTAERLQLVRVLLQHCLYPRSILSEIDAVYCYHFVMLMHDMNTDQLSSLTLIDKVLYESLPQALLTFTEYEAYLHSQFLVSLFKRMTELYKDEKVYLQVARGEDLIGFRKKWSHSAGDDNEASFLTFREFQHLMVKWHRKSSQLFEQALVSGEPHQIRNTFLMLREYAACFPMIREQAQPLLAIVKLLAQHEKRGDLKVLANSYLGVIDKHKAKWVSQNGFLGLPEPKPLTTSPAPAPAATAKPGSTSSRLERNTSSLPSSTASTPKDRLSSDHARRRDVTSNTSTTSSRVDRTRALRDEAKASAALVRSPTVLTSAMKSRLRSDNMPAPSSATANASSSSRHSPNGVSSSSSSRSHHRSSQDPHPTSSSSGRRSPRDSRSSDVVTPSTPSTPANGSSSSGYRARNPARDAVREVVKEPTMRSSAPATSASSSSSSSSRRKPDRPDRPDRPASSTTAPSPSSSSYPPRSRHHRSSNLHDPTPVSSPGSSSNKRPMDADKDRKGSEKRHRSDRPRTTAAPKDDRREKDRKDHRDSRRRPIRR